MSHEDYVPLQSFSTNGDAGVDVPPVFVEPFNVATRGRWRHISDLDDFFARVYSYHQRKGFICILMEDVLQLVQFVFVVLFSLYLAQCVRYNVLFADVKYAIAQGNISYIQKVSIFETVVPLGQCAADVFWPVELVGAAAGLFAVLWLIKIFYNTVKNWDVHNFYTGVLNVQDNQLPDVTWNTDILPKIIEAQSHPDNQLCVHKEKLSELDICMRILRFKNYLIAMICRPENILPIRFGLPCLGDCIYLSAGLIYSLEFLLFYGPFAPFETNWHLRNDYGQVDKRKVLAARLSRRAVFFGLINLLFFPLVFAWQLLYSFFSYTNMVRRDPTWLGARRWSLYGRIYCRLYNEMEHELDLRLSAAYEPACHYVSSFPLSPKLIILARGVVFFSGSILGVLLVLTLIDSDVLNVSGMFTFMTALGIAATIATSMLPDENVIYSPKLLLQLVQRHVRHIPASWIDHAHSRTSRNAFTALFQYKIVWLLDEILSPIITPFILIFKFPSKSLEIVDFLRNFTVDVVGVGDVCSFSLMDSSQVARRPSQQQQQHHVSEGYGGITRSRALGREALLAGFSADSKQQMSLVNFAIANPGWQPEAGQNQRHLVANVREAARSLQQQQQSLLPSTLSLSGGDTLMPSILASPGGSEGRRLTGPGVYRLLTTSDSSTRGAAPVMDRRFLDGTDQNAIMQSIFPTSTQQSEFQAANLRQ